MQATQSSNASDFFDSDSTGPRNLHAEIPAANARIRDLPSPFTAPIQAARKYLERQRSGASRADGGVAGLARTLSKDVTQYPVKEAPQNLSEDQGPRPGPAEPTPEQITREQDRRLERSLYEGHSIEAGLYFEEQQGFAEVGRAYLADGDGSEPLFPYATPGTVSRQVPDPATVRSAISRLARESGTISEPPQARPEGPVEVHSTDPSAFAYVARRVWEGSHDVPDEIAPAALFTASPDETFDVSEDPGMKDRVYRAAIEALGEAAAATRSTATVETPGDASVSIPEPMLATSAQSVHSAKTAAGEASAQRPPDLSELQERQMQAQAAETTPAGLRGGRAFDDAALAHDACNLLSALGLYSELLNFPGVVAEQHRHYAEELKMIAGRSQALIDRMLRLEDSANRETLSAPQTGTPMGIHVTPRPAAVPASTCNASEAAPGTETPLICGAQKAAETDTKAAATAAQEPRGTSLVDLLMRWGSLLSTLAHGSLDVCLGPQAATPVPIDAEPLERILVNLVRNARAATVAGGAIRIGVDLNEQSSSEPNDDGRTIVLTVDDSGCGMTKAQIDRILGTPVEGASAARISEAVEESVSDGYGRWRIPCNIPDEDTNRHGTINQSAEVVLSAGPFAMPPLHGAEKRRQGLGLQVVKHLVRDTGGKLAILSSPGRGTRVEIRWPVASAPARIETKAPVERFAGSAASAPETPLQPLLVEAKPAPQPPPPEVGPDGFSEAELRAMMLRLHRNGADSTRIRAARVETHGTEPQHHSAVKGAIAC